MQLLLLACSHLGADSVFEDRGIVLHVQLGAFVYLPRHRRQIESVVSAEFVPKHY